MTELAVLQAAAVDARCISLDVFDTALLRAVGRPIDVFALVAATYRTRYDVAEFDFASERVAAERRAREKRIDNGGGPEVTLAEIYGELRRSPGWDRDALLALELELECMVCKANPVFLELYRWARTTGREVVFTSDMYLPAEAIEKLLRNVGFDETRVFVSSEHRRSKGEGALYDHVLSTLGIDASQVLHVGDNAHSDVEMARQRGLRAHHYAREADQVASPTLDRSIHRGLVDISRVACRGQAQSLWQRLGYEVAGPIFVGFTTWLHERMLADGVDHAFFMARDGHILQRVYDGSEHAGPPSTYLYGSRRSFFVPSIARLDERTLDFLTSRSPMPVRDFLERVGLDAREHGSLIRAAGFRDENAWVKTNADFARLRVLFQSLERPLLARAKHERALLVAYLESIGFFSHRRVALVDIGWNGNVQRALVEALRLTGRDVDIRGYYLGTFETVTAARKAGHHLSGWLCNEGSPQAIAKTLALGAELLEFLHLAPHPSVVSYERGSKGEVAPTFGPNDADETKTARAIEVQAAALAFTDAFAAIARRIPWLQISATTALGVLERLVWHPDLEEARALGDLMHARGFGPAFSSVSIARPPEGLLERYWIPSLMLGYRKAYWRPGYATRVLGRALSRAALDRLDTLAGVTARSPGPVRRALRHAGTVTKRLRDRVKNKPMHRFVFDEVYNAAMRVSPTVVLAAKRWWKSGQR